MKLNKPHIYFWITTILFFIIGLVNFNSEGTLDINIHDTYYVIANFHLYTLLSIIFFFIGLMYYIHSKFKIPLINFLTILHTIITLGCVLLLYINPLFHKESEFPLFDESYINNFLIFIIGLAVQPIFIINSLLSTLSYLFRKTNKL